MTFEELTPLLRCPDCGESLAYERVAQRDPTTGTCGLLRCSCFTYPVLDGIPIVTRRRLAHRSIADDREVAGGPTPEDLVAHIQSGNGLDGLVDLLTFPVCPWPLNRIGAIRRLNLRAPHRKFGLAYRKRRIRRALARRSELTAEDWMSAFYWHSPAPFDPFNYFFFRFGQPRHLATLGLLSILPHSNAPLLDVACGYGHFLHTITMGGQPAVGIDQNFHQLWVARHYVAPSASFVCADAFFALPLMDNVFSAALCADAFYYVRDKPAVLSELKRCGREGPILLASVINRLADPTEADTLSPSGYAAVLHGWHHRAMTEEALLNRYLDGRGPDLRYSSSGDALDSSKWLYYIAAHHDEFFREHDSFDSWPHAAGDIQVNPIYGENRDNLSFHFPSTWYGVENAGMRSYMPRAASLDEGSEVPLARAVLVGLPPRYQRATGRSWTFKANRWLSRMTRSLRASWRFRY